MPLMREYVEIDENLSLDALIEQLQSIREALPEGAEPYVRLRGNDHFGRHIAIIFKRPLTDEEAALEARYGDSKADPLEHAA